jgi:drug/metabolite transporter (DMT)-like permease
LFLHEVIEKRKYVFIVLLFVGIYILIVGAHALQLNQGDLFIVIAAMTLGGTNVLSKFAMREMRAELVASLRMIVGAILLLGLVLLRSPHVLTALNGCTCWVLVSGLLMWGFIVFLYRAIEMSGAMMGTLVTISYPVVSTIGSVLFLNEELAVQDIVGGALILWCLYRLVGK